MKFLAFSQTKLGSSLTFSAQGGRDKGKNQKPAAKNFARRSEGRSPERGD